MASLANYWLSFRLCTPPSSYNLPPGDHILPGRVHSRRSPPRTTRNRNPGAQLGTESWPTALSATVRPTMRLSWPPCGSPGRIRGLPPPGSVHTREGPRPAQPGAPRLAWASARALGTRRPLNPEAWPPTRPPRLPCSGCPPCLLPKPPGAHPADRPIRSRKESPGHRPSGLGPQGRTEPARPAFVTRPRPARVK